MHGERKSASENEKERSRERARARAKKIQRQRGERDRGTERERERQRETDREREERERASASERRECVERGGGGGGEREGGRDTHVYCDVHAKLDQHHIHLFQNVLKQTLLQLSMQSNASCRLSHLGHPALLELSQQPKLPRR